MRARLVRVLVDVRVRADGQTGAEYLGLLLVIAAIIAALIATEPGQAIGDKLSEIVRDIAGER